MCTQRRPTGAATKGFGDWNALGVPWPWRNSLQWVEFAGPHGKVETCTGVGLETGGAAVILEWKGWSSAPQAFGVGRWPCTSSHLIHL